MINLKKTITLVGLIIVLLVIVLGIYWYANQPKEPEINQNDQTNTAPSNIVDMESFKKMASQTTICADKRNDLYLIDKNMVFWIREGECADNSYNYTLFSQTPQEVLCRSQDSFAGQRKSCTNNSYSSLFETLISHLNDSELGVGRTHRVEKF